MFLTVNLLTRAIGHELVELAKNSLMSEFFLENRQCFSVINRLKSTFCIVFLCFKTSFSYDDGGHQVDLSYLIYDNTDF